MLRFITGFIFISLQVYGHQITVDKHRPSAKNTTEFDDTAVEHDKTYREVFKSGKVRDVLKCGECHKARCVYSDVKSNREQVLFLGLILTYT